IKDRKVVTDSWELWKDAGLPPTSGDWLVPLSLYRAERAALAGRAGRTGVVVASDEVPTEDDDLKSLPLVGIDFPKFSDGRGYTTARLLRERFGYNGELRAVGDVLRDQLFYMARCGIDSFALKPGKDIQGALSAFDDFSTSYQAAVDQPQPLYRRARR